MMEFWALLIIINVQIIQGVLEWTVIGKVTDYGKNVTLFCPVPNCCPKDAGWDRWTPNQQTLFIDVKTGYSNKKYDGKVLKDGYTLIIQNLTEQDLNVSYSCLYGVTLGERKFLLEEDVFTRSPKTNVRNSWFSEGKIAALIAGVAALVSVLIIIEFSRRRKKRKPKKQDLDTEMFKLINPTAAVIGADIGEETFVTTKAVTDGLSLLKQNGVLLITGHAGTGKSRIGRHILHMFYTENTSYKFTNLTVTTVEEWENLGKEKNKIVVLIDDIFGETNCIYVREKAEPILNLVYSYVDSGKIKVIITIRDTVKRQCQKVFDRHRLFRFDYINLSNYVLTLEEKQTILKKYMKKFRKSDYTSSKCFVDGNGDTILNDEEISKITKENPVEGFPLAVYQFVNNDKYFHLGSTFFDRPTEIVLDEMNEIRRSGIGHRKFKIQYAVLVFTAINENVINPEDNSILEEVSKIVDAIYGDTINMNECDILDAVMELKGSYFINIPKQISYQLHHATLQESVILSFVQIDHRNMNKIIPLISFAFFLKMIKPKLYDTKEGEVVLKIPNDGYKLLADRLVHIYMTEIKTRYYPISHYFHDLSITEVFQQDYSLLLTLLLEALEKEDDKDKHTENMIKSDQMDTTGRIIEHTKNKEMFLSHLLCTLAASESQSNIYHVVLQKFNNIINTSNYHFAINPKHSTLVSSLYITCSTKNVANFKATLDIVEENEIPVLLDQGVDLSKIERFIFQLHFDEPKLSKPMYVFLTVCIWKAYKACNISVLQILLSKYDKTPFDVNLFFRMIYRKDFLKWGHRTTLSHKPLKWMIEKFAAQKTIDTNVILKTACQCKMVDTVKYLDTICNTLDAVSCLLSLVDNAESRVFDNESNNKELFNFLLTKIEITPRVLLPVAKSLLRKQDVPKYMVDAILPICLNNEILSLACKNGKFYELHIMMEKSTFQSQVDIKSGIISACMTDITYPEYASQKEKLKIIQYIVEKFGFDQLDIKAACQQACDSGYLTIVEWFVQNYGMTRLNVHNIINSAVKFTHSDIIDYVLKKIEIPSLYKTKIFECVAMRYTDICTSRSKILSAIWNSTDDKEKLKLQKLVDTAYERECFGFLMWIHDACNSDINIDSSKMFKRAQTHIVKIDTIKWILEHFKIEPSEIKSCVLNVLSHNSPIPIMEEDDLYNFVIFILEKYSNIFSTDDITEIMHKSTELHYYVLVNWLLENKTYYPFDKQKILNKACADTEIKTVKILINLFSDLDINQAMINVITSSVVHKIKPFRRHVSNSFQDVPTCLSLLWKKTNHDFSDISTVISAVCKTKVSNSTMTWILQNIPHHQIPFNEVLFSCCQQGKINHVTFIFHEVDNKRLDITKAFFETCRATPVHRFIRLHNNSLDDRILIDYLFQKLHDKESNLSIVQNELIEKKRFDLILYFLQTGYCKNINMTNLLKEACSLGQVGLVQWIVANVEHEKLDIQSAFTQACDGLLHPERKNHAFQFRRHRYNKYILCVAMMWHFIRDTSKFETDTVLHTITETTPGMSYLRSDTHVDSDSDSDLDSKEYLKTWLLYISSISKKLTRE